MSSVEHRPTIVDWTLKLEDATALDGAVNALEPHVTKLFGSGARGRLLRGEWLGHALHPLMTDVVVGTWLSAAVLDVLGGKESSGAAQRLVATGLLAAGPTAWTGWAEWSHIPLRDKRVGLVHASTNGVSIALYAASYLARRRGDHGSGKTLSLAGFAVSGVGAYLGGHLSAAKKVSSHHPAFDGA